MHYISKLNRVCSRKRRIGRGFESNDCKNIFQLHVDLEVMKCAYQKYGRIRCKMVDTVHYTIFYRHKILMFGSINAKSCYHFRPYLAYFVGVRRCCFFSVCSLFKLEVAKSNCLSFAENRSLFSRVIQTNGIKQPTALMLDM